MHSGLNQRPLFAQSSMLTIGTLPNSDDSVTKFCNKNLKKTAKKLLENSFRMGSENTMADRQ